MRSIRAIEHSDVCILMIDATRGIEAQDMNIFQLIQKNNKSLVVVVNKWDLVADKDQKVIDTFKKAQASIALNTRCKRCGKTLSSLERVVFENKCRECMAEESRKSRDKFVRKYIIIAFLFIVALVFGGYCANAGTKAWRIVGVIVSAMFTGVSLGYVFYTNMDKMMPGAQPKVQVWLVFGLALGIAAIIAFLTYFSKSWILYVVLMLGA